MDIWLFGKHQMMDWWMMDWWMGVSLLLTEKLSASFIGTHSFLPRNSGSTMAPRIRCRLAVLRRAWTCAEWVQRDASGGDWDPAIVSTFPRLSWASASGNNTGRVQNARKYVVWCPYWLIFSCFLISTTKLRKNFENNSELSWIIRNNSIFVKK